MTIQDEISHDGLNLEEVKNKPVSAEIIINKHLINCDVFYEGGNSHIENCRFDNCKFSFKGKAASTIEYLSSLYNNMGGDGKEEVEKIFHAIRKGNFKYD